MSIIRQGHQTVSSQDRYVAVVRTSLASMLLVLSWLEDKLEKRRSRRLLQELSDHQLKDIGVTRADAFREGQRPFWD